MCLFLETKFEDGKEIVQKQGSPVSSISTITPPTSASPKNLHFLKVVSIFIFYNYTLF